MTTRKREVFKFLSGLLAGAGLVHANMGFAIATGIFNEPHYLGHTWTASALWIGAAAYLIGSVLFGYLGWRAVDNSALGQIGSPRGSKLR